MTEPHPFDTAVALQAQADGSFLGHTSPAYGNMIGPYGGITAAQCLQAVLQHRERLGDPVALTINYAAAVADGAFLVRARAARTNRSSQHWIIEMAQGEAIVATATAVTALRRATWSDLEARPPQVAPPRDTPVTRRRGVEWLKRYEMRFLEGDIPAKWDGSVREHSRTRLWTRDQPPRPLDFASLTAMADVFFPSLWLRRARQTPIGTVSMTVYYHVDAAQIAAAPAPDGYVLLQAQGQGYGGGYFDQAGQLWDESGRLLATTHQVVYFKD